MNRLLKTILLTPVISLTISVSVGHALRDRQVVYEDIRLALHPKEVQHTEPEPEPEPPPEPIDPMIEYAKSLGYEGYYIQMVEVSAYDNCYYCTQSGEGITASGTVAGHGTIAAPSNFEFGTQLLIEGFDNTVFTIEDRGGAIYMTEDGVARIDMWVETHEQALQVGRFVTPAYIFY